MAKDTTSPRPNGKDHGKCVSGFYKNLAANYPLKPLPIDLFISFPSGPILALKCDGSLCPRFDCENCMEGRKTMRHSLKTVGKALAGLATAAAMAAALSLPAKAAAVSFASDIDLGTLTNGTTVGINDALYATPTSLSVLDVTRGVFATGSGNAFNLAYDFTLSAPSSGVRALVVQTGSISGLTISLISSAGIESQPVDLGQKLFANLSPGAYTVVFSGTAGSGISGLSASVSAVPLPGALLLFGSSLLGLGAVQRVRRRGLRLIGGKAAAMVIGLLGLAALPFFGASSAEAASVKTIETIDAGTVNVSATPKLFFLSGDSSPASSLTYLTGTGFSTQTGASSTIAGTGYEYVYTFSVSAPAQFSLNVISSAPTLTGSISDGTIIASASSANVLSLLATLTAGHNYVLTFSQGAGNFTGTGTISAVPIPGALVLFGSGLVGLATFARRKAKRAA